MKKHKKKPRKRKRQHKKGTRKKEDKERVFRSLPSFLFLFLYITSSFKGL